MFLLFDTENQIDPVVCKAADDVRAAISDLDGEPFQVLTIAVDEFCRDVTEDFATVERPEYPDHDAAASRADDEYQARQEERA